jgi:hypothetical protein
MSGGGRGGVGDTGIGEHMRTQIESINKAKGTIGEALTKAGEEIDQGSSQNPRSSSMGPGSLGRPSINPVGDWNQVGQPALAVQPELGQPEVGGGGFKDIENGGFGGKPVGGSRGGFNKSPSNLERMPSPQGGK